MSKGNTQPNVERVADGMNLLENLALIELQSWQTSQEVFADWRAGVFIGGVNTANLAVYRLVKGKPVLDLLAKEGNLFLDDRFRQETYKGILNQKFFIPSGDMLEYIMSAITRGKAVEVPYSGLKVRTEDCGEDYGFVEVNVKNISEEKKLIQGVYGIENPGNGKKIYLLRPKVVKRELSDNVNGAVVRACDFINDKYFYASDRTFNYDGGGIVSGVRLKNVAEVSAQKPEEDKKAYPLSLTNPDN